MNKVGYKQRECSDNKKISEFLSKTRTGVIGMISDATPYAVPVNYVWCDGSIYFHGMGSGKKENILKAEPSVCFTVYEEYGTVTDPVPCHADTAYMSVMLFGKAEKVTEIDEIVKVLQAILDKYTPQFYKQALSGDFVGKYRSAMDGNVVSVYRITPKEMTAKENSEEEYKLFGH